MHFNDASVSYVGGEGGEVEGGRVWGSVEEMLMQASGLGARSETASVAGSEAGSDAARAPGGPAQVRGDVAVDRGGDCAGLACRRECSCCSSLVRNNTSNASISVNS
jgi:hypothetical protein